MPLYVYPDATPGASGVRVSNIDPDSQTAVDDYEAVLKESFLIAFPANHRTPLETEAGIIRNIINNGCEGGAFAILR